MIIIILIMTNTLLIISFTGLGAPIRSLPIAAAAPGRGGAIARSLDKAEDKAGLGLSILPRDSRSDFDVYAHNPIARSLDARSDFPRLCTQSAPPGQKGLYL